MVSYSEDKEKLELRIKCYDQSFRDAKIEGKSPVRRLLVQVVQRRVKPPPRAVALGTKSCMCANLGFLEELKWQDFCGHFVRNIEGDWGV